MCLSFSCRDGDSDTFRVMSLVCYVNCDFVRGSRCQLSSEFNDNWAAGQPDNFNNEDCATAAFSAWSPKMLLNDLPCGSEQSFICQKRERKTGGEIVFVPLLSCDKMVISCP